jgi:hypothetical protein
MWQTPATDSFRSRGGDRKDEMGLDQQCRFWVTPNARDYRSETGSENNNYDRPPNLSRQVYRLSPPETMIGGASWPTPQEGMASGGVPRTTARTHGGKYRGNPMIAATEDFYSRSSHQDQQIPDGPPSSTPDRTSPLHWPTPDTMNAIPGDAIRSKKDRANKDTQHGESLHHTAYRMTGKARLNPRFVEWLMGFPISWTEP